MMTFESSDELAVAMLLSEQVSELPTLLSSTYFVRHAGVLLAQLLMSSGL